jgi:hypothetical protein
MIAKNRLPFEFFSAIDWLGPRLKPPGSFNHRRRHIGEISRQEKIKT